MPTRYTSSADTHAMVARIAPSILELLGDGMLRSRKAIVAALAGQHEKDEVVRTLMRLAVIGQVIDIDRNTACRQQPSMIRIEPRTNHR